MRVLVLGGTGFIGGPTVDRLREGGHSVATFQRSTIPPSMDGLPTYSGQRDRVAQLRRAVEKSEPDAIVDLLARTQNEAEALVQAVADTRVHVVVASSLDIYAAYEQFGGRIEGETSTLPLGEEAPLCRLRFPRRRAANQPPWERDYDKVLVERVLLASPLDATILRLPFVYGPGDYRDRLSPYIEEMMRGRDEIRIPACRAEWKCTRAFVSDVAEAIVACLAAGARGETFNVGEEVARTEVQWAEAIGRAVGWSGEIVRTQESIPGYVWEQHLVLDTSRIRRTLGFAEPHDRDDALAQTVRAWRAGPGRS